MFETIHQVKVSLLLHVWLGPWEMAVAPVDTDRIGEAIFQPGVREAMLRRAGVVRRAANPMGAFDTVWGAQEGIWR